MKKYFLALLFLICILDATAQHPKDSLSNSLQGNNEIKLNLLFAILGFPEITYERMLNHSSALGVSAFVRAYGSSVTDFSPSFYSYYRYYLGKRKSSGFFLEGHGAILWYDENNNGKAAYGIDQYGNSIPVSARTDTYYGFGGVLGAKFLTRKGFTGEIYGGGAKVFTKSKSEYVPRLGLT